MPDLIRDAFSKRPDIQKQIVQLLAAKDPRTSSIETALFAEIAGYVLELRQQLEGAAETNGQPAKKRKLNDNLPINSRGGAEGGSIHGAWSAETFDGVSFSVPQRKKLNLQVSANRKTEGIRAVAPGSSEPEFGLPWSEVEHVICLPVPEKAQAQKNFCVFPKGGDGVMPAPEGGSQHETMVWTAPDTKAKGAAEDEPTQVGRMLASLEKAKCKLQQPDEKEFASEVPQPGRKGEKAYHVKAFKGSKDGYLFFLSHGILWGFKKPLILFSFPVVDSISYTSVLQRTFNLVVSVRASPDATPQEHEFSMLDQADFAGIDAYVKRHGLQDASLAEARRAKKYNVNGVKKEEGDEGEVEDDDGEGELAKAQREAERQADDDDDEEEDENFDPGSEGESEGSGSSDEDEEGEGGEDGGDEDSDEEEEADLVADELGSAAEEVDMNDDE